MRRLEDGAGYSGLPLNIDHPHRPMLFTDTRGAFIKLGRRHGMGDSMVASPGIEWFGLAPRFLSHRQKVRCTCYYWHQWIQKKLLKAHLFHIVFWHFVSAPGQFVSHALQIPICICKGEVHLYSARAPLWEAHLWSTQVWITQFLHCKHTMGVMTVQCQSACFLAYRTILASSIIVQ